MPDKMKSQQQTQDALNLFETFADFARRAALKCHMVGLQGEKRRMRYLYRKALGVVDCLQHSAYDLFDAELYPVKGSTDVNSMTNSQTSMRKMIDTLWLIHDKAHSIANDMVVSMLKAFSEPIYGFCVCLMSIISEMQRNYKSYDMSGWDWHHISRHQETEANIHDEYEAKEENQGYSDHKEA